MINYNRSLLCFIVDTLLQIFNIQDTFDWSGTAMLRSQAGTRLDLLGSAFSVHCSLSLLFSASKPDAIHFIPQLLFSGQAGPTWPVNIFKCWSDRTSLIQLDLVLVSV